jgi:hypothetical protein
MAEDGVTVALPDGHPGARQRAFPIDQLDDVAPIMLSREANPPFCDGVLAAARAAGVTLHTSRASARSVDHALLKVVTGRVPAVLPASVSERHRLNGVCFVPLADPVPTVTAALVTRPDDTHPLVIELTRLVAALGLTSGRHMLARAA